MRRFWCWLKVILTILNKNQYTLHFGTKKKPCGVILCCKSIRFEIEALIKNCNEHFCQNSLEFIFILILGMFPENIYISNLNALISILCNFSVNLWGSCQIEYNEIIWVGTFALSGIANVTRALSSIGDPIGSTAGLALVRSSRARINTQRNNNNIC